MKKVGTLALTKDQNVVKDGFFNNFVPLHFNTKILQQNYTQEANQSSKTQNESRVSFLGSHRG